MCLSLLPLVLQSVGPSLAATFACLFVILQGNVDGSKVAELHAAFVLNDMLMVPSRPGATAINLTAGPPPEESGGVMGSLLGGGGWASKITPMR